jgi:hypothetical protein
MQVRWNYVLSTEYLRIIGWGNLVPRAFDPREGTWGSGIIRFREESDWPLVWNTQFNFSQDSWLPATDYPRASRSFPRVAGSGNDEIVDEAEQDIRIIQTESDRLVRLNSSDRLVRLNSAGKMAEEWHHAHKDFWLINWLIFYFFRRLMSATMRWLY